ncbi:MAG: magnesium transporter, partial [Chlamydiia bacterium]|nr:magnesium transporter [Chlamydiia bacterium]
MESRTSHLDDILLTKLEKAFHKPTGHFHPHDIAKIATEHDPIDLAYAVTRLPPDQRHVVYLNLPDRQAKVIFMINTDRTTRIAILRALDNTEIAKLIEQMPLDEAIWVLEDLSDRQLRRVLEQINAKRAHKIQRLLSSDRHSAARIMSDEFFAFPMETTIGEVSRAIRNNPGIDLTRRIFVVTNSGELIGFVPGRNLIINPPYASLRQVMRPVQHTVSPHSTREEVVDLVERYKIPALPVVDEAGIMQGVITYEDVVEAMEDITAQTIANIAGTTEDLGERQPAYLRAIKRSPWLCVTLCGGLITATAMLHADKQPWALFAPFFVPLINGMSGNVGIQCSSILVRGMSTGELSSGERFEVIGKELSIGLVIGGSFGLAVGCLIYALSAFGIYEISPFPFSAALTIGCGVLGACLNASIFGTFFP